MSGERDERLYESEFTPFTPEERLKIGADLAREISEAIACKTAKIAAVAGFAAELKQHEKNIAELTDKLNAGGEDRQIEVMVMFDHPEAGMKSFLRCSDNKVIRSARMTPKELQGSFGFQEPEDPK